MITKLLLQMRAFVQDTRGNMTLEAVIWLPLILTTIAATFSLHDAYRYKSLNTKAAYTISDAISRETDAIDGQYLDGMVDLMEFLTRSEGPYSLRVTQVRYNGKKKKYVSEWSQTRGNFGSLRTRDLTDMVDQLPLLLHNERVIVVETETDYVPPFSIPRLNEQELFYTFGFTRPRFAPKIVWNNG